MNSDPAANRRPLATRSKAWARALATQVARTGLTPNAISILSILFAAGSFVCFWIVPDMKSQSAAVLCWLGAAAGIQFRLLCNMLDGMVAVEHGKRSPVGGLYNEVPDRVADTLILVGAGYATSVEPGVIKLFGELPLGWSCAVLALICAYIRSLGAELTGRQLFLGPMAKQHRMFFLTCGCLTCVVELFRKNGNTHQVMLGILTLILAGTILTCWRRLGAISRVLRERDSVPPS